MTWHQGTFHPIRSSHTAKMCRASTLNILDTYQAIIACRKRDSDATLICWRAHFLINESDDGPINIKSFLRRDTMNC